MSKEDLALIPDLPYYFLVQDIQLETPPKIIENDIKFELKNRMDKV